MPYQPPNRIKFLSDDNEIQFVEELKPLKSNDVYYIYKYVVSKNKLGETVGFTEQQLVKLEKDLLIKKI